MKVDRDKVLGGSSVGNNGGSRHYWPRDSEEENVDYEAMFRSFMEKLFANRGAFTVGGSLSFEFLPKASVKNEKLISAETSFFFHQLEEGTRFRSEVYKNDNFKDSATASYRYKERSVLPAGRMEEFMPVI